MQFHQQLLKNGLQLIGETNPSARSVAVGFWVRTGSRDETPDVNGVTHYLEHMIFKGTPRRDALTVNRDFDAIGSHPNAFTSEENTVFHATLLPEYLPQAIDILADILRPSLRDADFDTEKEVILNEIGMYYDQPSYSAYEAAKQVFFGQHSLGYSILGTPESIGALTRDQMHAYFQRRYVASNITVVAAGNYTWDHLVREVESRCGGWNTGPAPRVLQPVPRTRDFRVIPKEKVIQEHAFLLAPGPSMDSNLRYAAEVLANAVGDDTGSRLYWALEDPGVVDTANLDFHEYDGTGVFFGYLSGTPTDFQEALEIAYQVLHETQKDGITDQEMQQAKSKLGSRIVRGSERPMGRMQSLGYYWTYLKKYRTVDDELQAVDAVTQRDVRRVLDEFPIDQLTTVALGPLGDLKQPTINGQP